MFSSSSWVLGPQESLQEDFPELGWGPQAGLRVDGEPQL